MMTYLLKDKPFEQRIVFANTGQEDERTLEFINQCAVEWGVPVVWVESDVSRDRGVGTGHKIVTYETATRDPSLFERMIEKYGIPNKNAPHCTRELKQRPISSYVRTLGWKPGNYRTAIGIRADEIDRVNPNYKELGLYYPLCDARIKRGDVFAFWDKQTFDLNVPEHRGNCTWCWKKSLRKQLTLARETPQIFDFAMRMEKEHAFTGPNAKGGPFTFFREDRGAKDIIELSRKNFEAFLDPRYLDQNAGCEESCEVHDPSQQISMVDLWREKA